MRRDRIEKGSGGLMTGALRLGLPASLALAATALPAEADAKPARAIPSWKQSHLEEGNQTVQSIYRLAACARMQRREATEAVFATVPGSAEERTRILAAVPPGHQGCPIRVRKLAIRNFVHMRGALAEALYNGERTRPRATALPPAEASEAPPGGSPLTVARWVARCTVSRNPVLAHEVVRFNPGGTSEGRALRALKPTFAGCLPSGERLEVSRLNMRALIAEALYRASLAHKESFANARS